MFRQTPEYRAEKAAKARQLHTTPAFRKKYVLGLTKARIEGRCSSQGFSGRHTPEAREKMRIAKIGKEPWNKGLKMLYQPRPYQKGRAAWNKGLLGFSSAYPRSESWKQKIGESIKVLYADSAWVAKKMRGLQLKPNQVEQLLLKLLEQNFPGEWQYTGAGAIIIRGLVPDFTHKRDKCVIEMFGDYWHTLSPEPKLGEEERRSRYREAGYRCLVIWEHELKCLPQNTIAIKVREWFYA